MSGADTHELREYATRLKEATGQARKALDSVVARAGYNMKKQLQAEARESKSFGVIARSIRYNTTKNLNSVYVDVGPVKGSPGSLANIAYFGTSRGGGTVPDPRGALDAEAPRFEEYVGRIVEDLL